MPETATMPVYKQFYGLSAESVKNQITEYEKERKRKRMKKS